MSVYMWPCIFLVFLAQPTTASRDLFSAAFAGQLVLHLDLRATLPIRLLQLGVVPAGACLYEGGWGCVCGLRVCLCVKHIFPSDFLEVLRECRGGGAPLPSSGYSDVIGKLTPLLPLVRACRAMPCSCCTCSCLLLCPLECCV